MKRLDFLKELLIKILWTGLQIIKKSWSIITTRIHEVLKTGVKVSLDKEKKLIVTIRKVDLAKETADARPEVFSPGNALRCKNY